MKQNKFTVSVSQDFLQRSYLWSILLLVLLTALVIFFDFSNNLAPFVFIFYLIAGGFVLKILFVHGLEYRIDKKMLHVEHRIVPWQRSALWRNLKNIKYTEVFKNRFYPNGYFHITLSFKDDEMDDLLKVHLSSSLQDVGQVFVLIDQLVKDGHMMLNENAVERVRFLMEQCDEVEV